jgi:hypothetical protein
VGFDALAEHNLVHDHAGDGFGSGLDGFVSGLAD